MSRRAELAARAKQLSDQGYLQREIAAELGVSRSYANDLLNDPDGSRTRARKESYGGTCIDCGARTNGSDGRAKASVRCARCAAIFQMTDVHGSPSMYTRCKCEVCRAGNRERMRLNKLALRAQIAAGERTIPADKHGTSTGYGYWGCRCAECRAAHAERCARYDVSMIRKASLERHFADVKAGRKAVPDHVHGTVSGYRYWLCRCDRCRTAEMARQRRTIERRRERMTLSGS